MPTYHQDAARSGHPTGVAPVGRLAVAFRARLDGPVQAQPLLLAGLVVAATETNYVYGLDPGSGAVRWRSVRLGTPVPGSALPCGDIDPLGITGTPAYDPASGRLFVVAESLSGGQVRHTLVALDPRTGAVLSRTGVDPAGQDPRVEQQRGALLIANGRVYIPYGGLYGDCGNYHGYLLGVPLRGGRTALYRTPSRREAGIWAPPGPVADRAGRIWVAVGNGAATGGGWDGSDSLVELSPGLRVLGAFAPRRWAADNAADADLGSTGPTLLPGGLVLAVGKSGRAYTVAAAHPGGVGGEVARDRICPSYGGTAVRGNSVYLPCQDGLRRVEVSAAGAMQVRWQAPPWVTGSPVLGGGAVFAVAAGRLVALSQRTGAVLGSVSVGSAARFATPALAGTRLYVPTLAGVVAVSGA